LEERKGSGIERTMQVDVAVTPRIKEQSAFGKP
jgi:hypothetical protein